jgi:small redox-active disulfide protein 2
MEIKILGSGCPNCKSLEKLCREIVAKHKIDAVVIKEEDIVKIMGYGVMKTPAIVINEKVIVKGRIPSEAEILNFLTQ